MSFDFQEFLGFHRYNQRCQRNCKQRFIVKENANKDLEVLGFHHYNQRCQRNCKQRFFVKEIANKDFLSKKLLTKQDVFAAIKAAYSGDQRDVYVLSLILHFT